MTLAALTYYSLELINKYVCIKSFNIFTPNSYWSYLPRNKQLETKLSIFANS